MKRRFFSLLLATLLCAASAAVADGMGEWVRSEVHGYIQLASYAGEYDGYVNVDGYGGVTAGDAYCVTVISKSASVWSNPKTNSKKLGSAAHGDTLTCRTEDGESLVYENGFYGITYKGKDGWINEDYVVNNDLTITLLESNVPAYIAPDTASKKVGSLSKMTAYRVIGFYDDYYIVNLRGAAAAYVPMSVKHRDNTFLSYYHNGASLDLTVTTDSKVILRTGPDSSYPEIRTAKAGTQLKVLDIIDDWFMVWDDANDQYAFVAPEDLVVEGVWESVG